MNQVHSFAGTGIQQMIQFDFKLCSTPPRQPRRMLKKVGIQTNRRRVETSTKFFIIRALIVKFCSSLPVIYSENGVREMVKK